MIILTTELLCTTYNTHISEHGWLHTWASVCAILAPILGACVFILTVFDLCCTYCCSSTLKSFILSGAEVRVIRESYVARIQYKELINLLCDILLFSYHKE